MARLAGCLSMWCSTDPVSCFAALAFAVSLWNHGARCTCRQHIQQVKTGVMLVRYFRTGRYKLFVNEPPYGILFVLW